jgi:hypothetical protein
MAITPNRPRQRVSPSPTGKDSLLINGESTATRANGSTRLVDRKEQQQAYSSSSSSQSSSDFFLPKRPSSSRDHDFLHWYTCYKQQAVAFLVVLVILTAALSIFMRTALSLEVPSRSLSWKIHESSYLKNIENKTLDQLHINDNPHPKIVWLMSFPNRYVKFY